MITIQPDGADGRVLSVLTNKLYACVVEQHTMADNNPKLPEWQKLGGGALALVTVIERLGYPVDGNSITDRVITLANRHGHILRQIKHIHSHDSFVAHRNELLAEMWAEVDPRIRAKQY